jgi:hypothetical protein
MKLNGLNPKNLYNILTLSQNMPTQDTTKIKDSIIEFLKNNGPNLPIPIARNIKIDSLFTSAFLSELLSQKKIKITNMKVGGSPIYYTEGTEQQLEKYAGEYLKSKEKDAFFLLQQKKFLIDSEQEPAIRIALRSIRDFAIPLEKENKLIWKYYITEEESQIKEKPIEHQPIEEQPKHNFPQSMVSEVQKELEKNEEKIQSKTQNIEEKQISKKPIKKKLSTKPKVQDKKNERFFNTIKETLAKKQIEIIDIIGFSKGDLTLKIKEKEKEKILVAYNKKRLTELDITNAYKKAKEHDMGYIIFTLGEPAKKTTSFIEAIKNLSSIEKIE